jgi:superfamily II DNA or RNA helicase
MIEIHIHGSTSQLKNYSKEVLSAVDYVTSYPVEGCQYSKAFRKGTWDGRKRLFRKRTGAFPTGLVKVVRRALEGFGYEIEVVDHREVPTPSAAGYSLHGVTFDYPYDYQLDACNKMVEEKQGIVKIATNGGKTECSCAVTQYLGLKTLFVVTTKELLYQGRKRFMLRLGLDESQVGIVGDGNWSPGSKVTVAILDTLESRLNTPECQKLLKETEVLFIDECHHTGSETWYTVATLCPAYYRFGLSGTPLDRTDGANLRLIAATGEVIVDIDNKFLVDRDISAKAHIIFDKITEPVLKKGLRYPTVYKQGVVENPQMLEKIIAWTKVFYEAGLGTLILCEEIQHGKLIDDSLWTDTGGVFIPHQFIWGEENSEVRQKALGDFANGNLPVLIASTILDEGIDVPTIDALILAGSRKSRIRTMQRLGRGLRGRCLVVVEFSNFGHKYLIEHSLKRLEDYRSENCFSIYSSGPDLELVKKIWGDK